MLTQREYDIRQMESELKMQRLFDEWRRGFLGDRLVAETPFEQDGELVVPDTEDVEDIYGAGT